MTTQADTAQLSEEEFLKQCRPKLEALEEVRHEKLALYRYRKKIAIPIAAVITPFLGFIDFWLLKIQSGSDDEFAGLTVLALAALWHWATSPKRQYARAYKSDILPEIANLFGDFTFDVKGKISMIWMKASKIIPNHSRYESEDYFKGSYKGIGIEFSEIKLTRRSGKRTVTVFDGVCILLKLNHKKFFGHTILTKDMGKVSEWLKKKTDKLKRANLVDPEFEKEFDVFTNDQVEARYLIDLNMIEDIKALHSQYNKKGLSAAFYRERMLILVSSKENHFEPADIYTRAATPDSVLGMKREVHKILSIVDKLSLYDPRKIHKQSTDVVT